ncbi:helix-turn-helix domain-containing protein [Flavobacterium sp. Sd200]|uniref:helix-turn-helix domain-containing protein n=1 Tax=Flavobacterium sp. Sd200 TaxID=2692211 RepID=UPI00136E1709|nr:AraC family transcriptional regulator [Flavobacterium sp. Sd200]MXN90304.1 helix-turn-helix domain-containing protein [Flavobacterium sp. Sd200]
MNEIFQTFKPKDSIIKKYVDYYYLDIKPNNINNEFQCFPHFNNTISLYKSHLRLKDGEIKFEETAKPFQIFTPIRKKVLNVKQLGNVYRIVIVFHPLGIQQFYENLDFSDYIIVYDFFTQNELEEIFSTIEPNILTNLLYSFLKKRFKKFENIILEKCIKYIFDPNENFSVSEISSEIGISRQHLNRVFRTHLGVSVKKFHEIILFRKMMNKKLFENSRENFTELAYEFNFNDQSHFNKSYKNLTENSPKNFFNKGTVLGEEDTFWHLQS